MFNIEGLGYFGSKKPAHLLGIYIYKDVYANGIDVKKSLKPLTAFLVKLVNLTSNILAM